jgi:hypothetical protein
VQPQRRRRCRRNRMLCRVADALSDERRYSCKAIQSAPAVASRHDSHAPALIRTPRRVGYSRARPACGRKRCTALLDGWPCVRSIFDAGSSAHILSCAERTLLPRNRTDQRALPKLWGESRDDRRVERFPPQRGGEAEPKARVLRARSKETCGSQSVLMTEDERSRCILQSLAQDGDRAHSADEGRLGELRDHQVPNPRIAATQPVRVL